MLKQATTQDHEAEMVLLAKIVWKDITSYKGFSFDGKFPPGCQQESVPSCLKTLVPMILNGVDLQCQDSTDSQASLTISQTLRFNFSKHTLATVKSRHSLEREPPLPLYM